MKSQKFLNLIISMVVFFTALELFLCPVISHHYCNRAKAIVDEVPPVFPLVWADAPRRIRGEICEDPDAEHNLLEYERTLSLLTVSLRFYRFNKEAEVLHSKIFLLVSDWHQRSWLE